MQPHPVLSQHYHDESEKAEFVRKLFDKGAPFYDGICAWGFLGSGTAYRGMAQRRAGLVPGMRVLDCAAGTGLMSEAALKNGIKPEDIVCLDVSPGMLEVAKKKLGVQTLVASADSIPLPDNEFDFVMMGYALRHVAALETTFGEYFRVLRPGGRLLIPEITAPRQRFLRWCFKLFFHDIYPGLTRLFTRSRDAQVMMQYYWETMDAAVRPEIIMDALREAGFVDVKCNILGRLFYEYTATKPAATDPGQPVRS